MSTTTDKPPTIEEIREARARHKASFDRYWTDYKYTVRSDAPGGCDADIKTMHKFEDNAPRYIDFLLAEVERLKSEIEFWQKENVGSHVLGATMAGLLTNEQNAELQRLRGQVDLATENGLKDTARLIAVIDCGHCVVCADHK